MFLLLPVNWPAGAPAAPCIPIDVILLLLVWQITASATLLSQIIAYHGENAKLGSYENQHMENVSTRTYLLSLLSNGASYGPPLAGQS